MTSTIDGKPRAIQPGERLIDVINRCEIELPQVCYHPQLGPIQTCDTCMVEVDGEAQFRAVEIGKKAAAIEPRLAVLEWSAQPHAVRMTARLDFDDSSAVVGQLLGHDRAGGVGDGPVQFR